MGVYSVDDFDDYDDYAPGTNDTRSQTVDYGYDYLNRMISRTVDADDAGTTHSPATEYFVYDHDASTNWGLKNLSTSDDGTIPFGANPATDAGQIVLQLDETGAPTHRYLWGPAVDMLLADEAVDSGADQTPGTADDVRWTLTDHQNSVRDIVVYDEVAEEWRVGNHVTYDAWGNTLAETDAAISGLFGWTGRPRDELTGLQTNGNRWYDAVLAHWQSEDPIAFAAGDANLYRYCGNDPVNWVDPSGLEENPDLPYRKPAQSPLDNAGFWEALRMTFFPSALEFAQINNAYQDKEALKAGKSKSFKDAYQRDDYNQMTMTRSEYSREMERRQAREAARKPILTGPITGIRPCKTEADAIVDIWREHGLLYATFFPGGLFDHGVLAMGGLAPPTASAAPRVHGCSLDYVGETHVYRIKGPIGTFKIGESMQGVRIRDGASIRGETQARALQRQTGDFYWSEIRTTFSDKAAAREYETRLIERYRRMFGDDTLPGNKTNR